MTCWLRLTKSSQPEKSATSKDSLLVELRDFAPYVEVEPSDVKPVITADPDDDFILACAVVGRADYLVSYDAHFDVLEEGEYQGIKITEALPFCGPCGVTGHRPLSE